MDLPAKLFEVREQLHELQYQEFLHDVDVTRSLFHCGYRRAKEIVRKAKEDILLANKIEQQNFRLIKFFKRNFGPDIFKSKVVVDLIFIDIKDLSNYIKITELC